MSINNKRSYTEYTVTTATTDFVIGFDEYDDGTKDTIVVTVNGDLAESQGYAVIRKNAQVLTITPAVQSGTVRLTRETDIDEPFHKFTAGALFSAKSVDENFQQVRHSQQEVRDAFVYTTNYVKTTLRDYDARIVEVEDSQDSSNQRLATEIQARKQGDLDSRRYAEDILGMGTIWDGISTRSVIDAVTGLTQADINAAPKLDTGITATAKLGGVERTQADKNSDSVHVADFGAVGIGDETAKIQAAINANNTVDFGDKGIVYTVSRLQLKDKTNLKGIATLDFSKNPKYANNYTSPLLQAKGSAGSVVMVTADIKQNATTITVASTSGINDGDIIEIATPNHNGGYTDSSTTVHNGELIRVESVLSSTSIKLSEPVIDEGGYSVANNAQIRKINTVNDITIGSGITIKGKGRPAVGDGDYGLILHYARDTRIHANFIGVDFAIARFEGCYNTEVSGCQLIADKKGTSGSLNYGIVSSGSSKHVNIFNNRFQNMRHGVVTAHLSSTRGFNVWGVSRLINVYNNTFSNTWAGAIATHNDADRVKIYGNTISNCVSGVNARERNVWIYNNDFISNVKDILLSAHPKQIYVYNNTSLSNAGGSFLISSFDGTRAITDISISNNVMGTIENGRGINLIFNASDNPSNINIIGNTIDKIKGDSALAAGIALVNSPVKNIVIKDNILKGVEIGLGIYIDQGGEDILINNNTIECVSDSKGISTLGTYTNLIGKGNFIKTLGVKWSGAAKAKNYDNITTDNTWY